LEVIGVILLVILILGPLVMAWGLGFSIGRIVLDHLGVLVAGALGAVPGAVCWLLNIAGSASGASPMPAWPTVLFLVGSAGGGLTGLLAAERLIYRSRFQVWAYLSALAGFAVGGAVSFLTLLLMQDSAWAEQTWLILSPLMVAATTVGGYSLLATRMTK
jgi:hypothetical protein